MRRPGLCLAALVALAPGVASAAAGVSGFRLSEVVTAAPDGDPGARYVELEATIDACVFPSTRIVAFDTAGAVVGDAAPFASTTCVTAGTYLLLATPAAQSTYATAADSGLVPALPEVAGQVCLVSSATRYDCVRWGPIATPIHDLFGPADDSSAASPPGGIALARVDEVHVIAADWRTETPTPRRPNDGSPWDPSDAGIDAPRADAAIDAPGVDALVVDAPRDAPAPDANQAFLDLDPVGGAGCGCSGAPARSSWLLALAFVLAWLRARSTSRPRR